jgi:Family of unknown function (DUF5372)
LGSATITHPFHPLKGQRFDILKTRRLGGVDTLILRGSQRGTFSVPREWTDLADPALAADSGLATPLFDARALLALVQFLQQHLENPKKGIDEK